MTGLTMTDCSVADNVTQARWEFDSAYDRADTLGCDPLRIWALKWGRALLVAIQSAYDDGAFLENENDNFRVVHKDELRDAEDRIKELTGAIKSAINALEAAL